jgi:RNA polymerase sigma-70 factor (ECF subfamily)
MSTDRSEAAPGPVAMTTTVRLLARAREGDADAINALFERCLPPLRRWARGRLPRFARDMLDTQDVVQETVIHTLRNLKTFELRHQNALNAYLRQAVDNRIRDELRKLGRRPHNVPLDADFQDATASPLEQAIGRERFERYEAALARLKPTDREAIVGRIELQCDFARLAEALGKPSPAAARVAFKRALTRLIEELNRGAKAADRRPD